MKKLNIITLIALFLIGTSVNAQELKKLAVNKQASFDKTASIYIELSADKVSANDHLKNALVANGFKVVTDKSVADYVVTMTIKDRSDTGCGKRVIKEMTGTFTNVKKSEAVAVFSFSQSNFEGNCTVDVMNALAAQLK